MADALRSGRSEGNLLGVQVSPPALCTRRDLLQGRLEASNSSLSLTFLVLVHYVIIDNVIMSRKQYYEWEKILKGSANHRRLEILLLLKKEPDMSTDEIVERLKINYQTGAGHVQKLVHSGLIIGYKQDRYVLHKISPLAESIITLLIMS